MCFYMSQETQGQMFRRQGLRKSWRPQDADHNANHSYPVHRDFTVDKPSVCCGNQFLPWIFPRGKLNMETQEQNWSQTQVGLEIKVMAPSCSLPSLWLFSFLLPCPSLSSSSLYTSCFSYIGCTLSCCYVPPFICTREKQRCLKNTADLSRQPCKGRRQRHIHSPSVNTWNLLE